MPKQTPPPLLQGTLDLMILKVLALEENHGYGVARRIEAMSDGVLLIEEGSLYPALHRLEKQRLLRSDWRRSEANRRAKYYQITAKGGRRLAQEIDGWQRMSAAIGRIVGASSGPAGT